MNSKILLFALTAILASLLLVSAASAALATVSSPTVQLTKSQSTGSVTVTPADAVTLSLLSSATQTKADSVGKLATLKSILSGNTTSFNASHDSALRFGVYSFAVNLFALNTTDSANETIPVTVNFVNSFCKSGDIGGNLSIDSVDISSSGEENLEWMPLDEITVEVKVEDTELDDESTREVIVELGLFNEEGKNVIGDMEFSGSDEEKIEVGTIKDGDSSKVTFTFKVPADFNFDDGSDYKLAVKAYSDKEGESEECTDTADFDASDFYETVTVDRQTDEDKFIAFGSISLSQEEVTCGDIITLDATAYNVGDSDQDDLIVYLDNKAMKIAQQKEFKNGVQMDDSVLVSFEFVVPQGLKDGFYNLELSADYDDGNSDEATPVTLKVLGCNTAPVTNQTTTTTETTEEPAEKTSAWESVKGAFSGNGLIWLVAAINIILILVIIVVAVRIARR